MSDENDKNEDTVTVTMSVPVPRTYRLTVAVPDDEGGQNEIIDAEPDPDPEEVHRAATEIRESFGASEYAELDRLVDEALDESDEEG